MNALPIDTIATGQRFRREMGDIDALGRSIEEIGLLHPIVVTLSNELVTEKTLAAFDLARKICREHSFMTRETTQ